MGKLHPKGGTAQISDLRPAKIELAVRWLSSGRAVGCHRPRGVHHRSHRPTATAAVSTATAAAAVATPAAAIAAATPSAAGRTRFARTRFVYGQRPAFDGLAIELGDCFLRVRFARHRDESEAARLTGELILHQRDFLDRSNAGEHVLEIGLGGVEGKISYV